MYLCPGARSQLVRCGAGTRALDPRCFEQADGSGAGSKGEQEKKLKYESALGVPILKRDEAKKLLPGWEPTGKLADA